MQVNFNPSVNQSRPQFKALKGIKIEGEALQNCARAQKELLTIFEHPNIKKLFQKYDGEVVFRSYVGSKNSYPVKQLEFSIDLFDNFSKTFSKIKQEYLEKAKKANVSTDRFERIDLYGNTPDHKYPYLYGWTTLLCNNSDIFEKSQETSEYIKKEMNNSEKYNEIFTNHLVENEQKIRNEFDYALNIELKLQKDKRDEIQAVDDVANKLKELLGE
ncbi:hypothetical protein IJ384_02735 [bacterium]|nr:hypothetical protein [bacterium]